MKLESILTFVGGLIAGFITMLIAERRIQMKNVTQERAKWRKQICEKSADVFSALISRNRSKLNQLRYELTILLNPFDREDKAILQDISLAKVGKEETQARNFSKRIALLLKDDWERAKLETHWYGFLCENPRRINFVDYQQDPTGTIQHRERESNCQCFLLMILLSVITIGIIIFTLSKV